MSMINMEFSVFSISYLLLIDFLLGMIVALVLLKKRPIFYFRNNV